MPKDKIYWAVMEKRWFSNQPVALFGTEAEAESAADLLWSLNGGADRWTVKRLELTSYSKFEAKTTGAVV